MPLRLCSTVKKEEFKEDGCVELALHEVAMPVPKDNEVVVRVEAAPINPSDLGLLFGPADVSTLRQVETIAPAPSQLYLIPLLCRLCQLI